MKTGRTVVCPVFISESVQSNKIAGISPMNADNINQTRNETVGDVYDKQEAIRKLGSESLLQKVTLLFMANAPRHMNLIRKAIDENDSDELRRSAHTFASSMAYFAAETATKAGRDLEAMGEAGDMSSVEQGYEVLKNEVDRLKEALSEVLPEEKMPRES
jgi:HPt (histidine-containing phosphotransfer) domain-containing protein